MITNPNKHTELEAILGQTLLYHKVPIACLNHLIMTLINMQSINFQHLMIGFHTGARAESDHRRIQCFF